LLPCQVSLDVPPALPAAIKTELQVLGEVVEVMTKEIEHVSALDDAEEGLRLMGVIPPADGSSGGVPDTLLLHTLRGFFS
jgi:hypothetical protein